jgi:hypothetical protein
LARRASLCTCARRLDLAELGERTYDNIVEQQEEKLSTQQVRDVLMRCVADMDVRVSMCSWQPR